MPSPVTEFGFADLVVCSDASLRSAFGIGSKVGIVVESRKKDGRITYVRPDRSLWVPFRGLRCASEEESARSPLAIVHRLTAELGGTALELSAHGERAIRLVMRHGALTPERIDELRAMMGHGLVAWRIRPGSMRRLESVMELSPGESPR